MQQGGRSRKSAPASGRKDEGRLPLTASGLLNHAAHVKWTFADTYGLTVMRSLMSSNTSFGTTFLATNSPFTL